MAGPQVVRGWKTWMETCSKRMETGFPARQFLPAESWHVCAGSVGYLPLPRATLRSSVLHVSLQRAPLSRWHTSGV